jgi:hypothetical protein
VRFVLALAALLLWAAPVVAQRNGVQLQVAVPSAGAVTDAPIVTTGGLLADPNTREILRAGFATKIQYRVELWRKGSLFYNLADRAEWDVTVYFNPTDQLYHVIRRSANQLEDFGAFATVTTAEAQFGKAFRAPIRPNRSGRYYYVLVVEVQPMQESDLDALLQWARGPTSPANNGIVIALRGGVGRLMSRVLGGDKQHYDVRSRIFSVP